MEHEGIKECGEKKNGTGLKSTVNMIMSIYLLSILFFIFIFLAFKSDIRTSEIFGNPLPAIIIMTNIAGALYMILHSSSKKSSFKKHNISISLITLISSNLVLGYCTYMYLNSLRLDDLLLLFMAGFLLKYIMSHLALMIDNVHTSKSFIRNK